jgi:hypothetical protein
MLNLEGYEVTAGFYGIKRKITERQGATKYS